MTAEALNRAASQGAARPGYCFGLEPKSPRVETSVVLRRPVRTVVRIAARELEKNCLGAPVRHSVAMFIGLLFAGLAEVC